MKKLWSNGTFAVMALLLAAVCAGWTPQALAAEGKTATVTSAFKVEGMTCGGCEAGIRIKVKKLPGVERVEASHEENRVQVTYDPKKVTPQRIIQAIEELGYSAELAGKAPNAGAGKTGGG